MAKDPHEKLLSAIHKELKDVNRELKQIRKENAPKRIQLREPERGDG